jgi:hypothetical protein
MANPIPCGNDHGEAASILLTNMENGDTRGLCLGCAPADLRAIADAIEGVTAEAAGASEPEAEAPTQPTATEGEPAGRTEPETEPEATPAGGDHPATATPA